jgi:hypothetical protein
MSESKKGYWAKLIVSNIVVAAASVVAGRVVDAVVERVLEKFFPEKGKDQ